MNNDAAVTVTGGFTRPEPPYEAPDGQHWEAAQAGPEWGIAGPGRNCRYRGTSERSCGEPASLVLLRGIRLPIPWNYCAADALEHYGTWAEGEKVMTWKLRDDPPGK